jgi:hypothetical protein
LEEEDEHEFSDVDNEVIDQNIIFEEDIQEESEISGSEEEGEEATDHEQSASNSSRDSYRDKNDFVWSKTDFSRTWTTPAGNIVFCQDKVLIRYDFLSTKNFGKKYLIVK